MWMCLSAYTYKPYAKWLVPQRKKKARWEVRHFRVLTGDGVGVRVKGEKVNKAVLKQVP